MCKSWVEVVLRLPTARLHNGTPPMYLSCIKAETESCANPRSRSGGSSAFPAPPARRFVPSMEMVLLYHHGLSFGCVVGSAGFGHDSIWPGLKRFFQFQITMHQQVAQAPSRMSWPAGFNLPNIRLCSSPQPRAACRSRRAAASRAEQRSTSASGSILTSKLQLLIKRAL